MEIKTDTDRRIMEDFRFMKPEDFLSEYMDMAIGDNDGRVKTPGKKFKGDKQKIISHADAVRYIFREMYLKDPWKGTIEERLLDGYLYCITSDDLSLSREELLRQRAANRTFMPDRREVFVQTGKAGVLAFVSAGRRQGDSEETIAKKIWIEMRISGVDLYVNIKNLKVDNTNAEEKDKPEKKTAVQEAAKPRSN